MINVIDNALPEWMFKRLEDVTKNKMSFKVTETTFDEDGYGNPYYNFSLLVENTNPFAEIYYNSFLSFSNDYCKTEKELSRIRVGVMPRDIKPVINQPHVDHTTPHTVGLLYLNDCDGDTYIYKNQYNYEFKPSYLSSRSFNNELFSYVDSMGWSFEKNSYGEFKDYEILERVTPKRNRLVIFDGSHFHSSSTPTTQQMRWVINYNFQEVI